MRAAQLIYMRLDSETSCSLLLSTFAQHLRTNCTQMVKSQNSISRELGKSNDDDNDDRRRRATKFCLLACLNCGVIICKRHSKCAYLALFQHHIAKHFTQAPSRAERIERARQKDVIRWACEFISSTHRPAASPARVVFVRLVQTHNAQHLTSSTMVLMIIVVLRKHQNQAGDSKSLESCEKKGEVIERRKRDSITTLARSPT